MAISSLLQRMGFVKLDDFGLVLTPDGRILSVRPTVLDDGLGGKIVGWQEGDLAAMELAQWEPAVPARKPSKTSPPPLPRAKPPTAPPMAVAPVAPFVSVAPVAPLALPLPPPPAVAMQRPLLGMTAPPMAVSVAVAQPVGAIAPKSRRLPTPIPLETHPIARVDDHAEVGEDDEWEWEIAVARARAAAEWAEEAAQQLMQPKKKRATSPIAIVAEPKRITTESFPKTEPLLEAWENTSSHEPVRVLPRLKSVTPAKPIVIVPRETPAVVAARAAVTAAPRASSSVLRPREPLQRAIEPKRPITTTSSVISSAPRRYPRATPQTTPDAYGAHIGDDTQVNHAAAPANDDQTRPGLLLPPASNTRRVAAKQR